MQQKLEEDNKGHKSLRFMNAEAEEGESTLFNLRWRRIKSPHRHLTKPKPKPRSPSNIGALGNHMDPRSPRDRALARKKELEDSGRSENNMPSNQGSHRKSSFIEYNIERIKSLKPSSPIDKEDKTVFIVHGQIKEKKDMNLVDFSRRPDPHKAKKSYHISPVSRDPSEEERSRQASFHTLDLLPLKIMREDPQQTLLRACRNIIMWRRLMLTPMMMSILMPMPKLIKTGQSESERGQIKNKTKSGIRTS